MKRSIIYLLLLPFLGACSPDQTQPDTNSNDMRPFPDPKSYWCQRLDQVVIDGNLDEWSNVAWTDYFQDIEGAGKPEPRFKTRAKMAWNNDYLFIAAELEEPHVWATLTKRDTIIFYDNDFEVFIDPDGDNHHYYELEVNALETAWDLLLTMPYRDFGHVIDSWDISGLDVGVAIQGTLNNPEDQDQGWTVELALPFRVLEECNSKGGAPTEGDFWRINFSRVEWQVDVVDGRYVKRKNPETGKTLPEDNWVWSPQHHINMHMPEYWGYLVFTESKVAPVDTWTPPADEQLKWLLRNLYYQQTAYRADHGKYATSLSELGWNDKGNQGLDLRFQSTFSGYQAVAGSKDGFWMINENGWIRKISHPGE